MSGGILDAAWDSVTRGLFSTLGGGATATLTRPNTMKDVRASKPVRSFVAAAPAAAGATTLTLRLPGSTALYGALLAGTKLDVGGQALTLTADAEIAAQGVTNLPVAFSPALVAPVAAGAGVTVGEQAEFLFTDVQVSYRNAAAVDSNGTLVTGRSRRLGLRVADAPTVPRVGDGIIFEDGSRGRVAAEPSAPGQWWDLVVG